MYVTAQSRNRVHIWTKGAVAPTRNLTGDLKAPVGIFATVAGDIFVDNGVNQSQVEMWSVNQTNSTIIMHVSGRCYSLVVDINNTLYCCMGNHHMVVKRALSDNGSLLPTIVAGNGTGGTRPNMLNSPYGIFVDTNFTLYVADSGNRRVQVFRQGQVNATTVLVTGVGVNFTLSKPTAIALDGDGYLFIVDNGNDCIIGSGPNGFRCVAGCSYVGGITADRLNAPFAISFDSTGNIFISDSANGRVQKFILCTNSCGE